MKISVAFEVDDKHRKMGESILRGNEVDWNMKDGLGEIMLVLDNDFPRNEKVRFIQTLKAGVDNIDFSSIPESTIVASNAGAYSISVAEHAFALLLERTKRTSERINETKRGIYNPKETKLLYGKTMGIIGYGGIGSRVAMLSKAFGMKVIAVWRSYRDGNADEFYRMDELDTVLSNSDFVLITVPLTRKTFGLIGRRELELLKKDSIIINVARAEIVKENDLLDFIKSRSDVSYLTDVWWNEPKLENSGIENIAVTPHIAAGLSEDVMDMVYRQAFENIKRFIDGKPVEGIVSRDEYLEMGSRKQ